MGIGWKVSGVLALLLLAFGGLGYWYFDRTETKLADLNQQIGEAKIAIETQEQSIKLLKGQITTANALQDQMSISISAIREETAKIGKTFGKHDIGDLAARKPQMIERRINDGTHRVIQDFEDMTDPSKYGVTK